nr:MAG TPA: PPPDE putative peptidase domain [Caudoviricetes sp.]
MHKYKTSEVVQILNIEESRRMHGNIPSVYPKPYTMGIIKNINDVRDTHLYIEYLGISGVHNRWWHLSDCVRYIPRKELQAMIAYYTLYKRSTWFSVRDFYNKVSPLKKLIEEALLEKMNIYGGCEYRVLCGNCQNFTAGFMMFDNLYIATRNKVYIIDTKFIEAYLQGDKE